MENWNIKIIDKGYKTARDIYIFRKVLGGTEVLGSNNTSTVYSTDALIPDTPTLELSPETLQAFADALDSIGIKPQKGFLEGKLDATEKHLEDMRTLVFKKN